MKKKNKWEGAGPALMYGPLIRPAKELVENREKIREELKLMRQQRTVKTKTNL